MEPRDMESRDDWVSCALTTGALILSIVAVAGFIVAFEAGTLGVGTPVVIAAIIAYGGLALATFGTVYNCLRAWEKDAARNATGVT